VSIRKNVGGSLSWCWNNLGFSSGDEVLVREKDHRCWPFTAVVGRSPSLLAVRRRWWSACGSRTGRSWCLGGGRER